MTHVVTQAGHGWVDAHVHFWDPARFTYPWLATVPPLDRPFLPSDLAGALGRELDGGPLPLGVVAVEADRLAAEAPAEARWLGGLGTPAVLAVPVLAVVAHAPLELGSRLEPGTVEGLVALPRVTGVRRLLQDEPAGTATAPGFVAGAGLLAGAGATLDLCVREHQLAEVTELVRRLPDVTFVLDHLGKPRIEPAALGPWAADLHRLAALPNVRCKLSGLATEAEPAHRTPAHLLPFLRTAVDAFGPGRCMFGSDWPVLTLATGYRAWLDVVREAVADLTDDERDQIMRRTALATYRVAAVDPLPDVSPDALPEPVPDPMPGG